MPNEIETRKVAIQAGGHVYECQCGCNKKVLVVSEPNEQGIAEAVIQK